MLVIKNRTEKAFFTFTFFKLVDEILKKTSDEITDDSNDLQEGLKIIFPSNIIDLYSRLEILLGLKLSGHTDILTQTSNLIDELYKRCEIQNERQYRNALDKFKT